jgi:hypothetical protein
MRYYSSYKERCAKLTHINTGIFKASLTNQFTSISAVNVLTLYLPNAEGQIGKNHFSVQGCESVAPDCHYNCIVKHRTVGNVNCYLGCIRKMMKWGSTASYWQVLVLSAVEDSMWTVFKIKCFVHQI